MSKIKSIFKNNKKKIIFSGLLLLFFLYLKIPISSGVKEDNFFNIKNNVQINKNSKENVLFREYISILNKNKDNFRYNILKYKCLKENNFEKIDFNNLGNSEKCIELNNFLNNKEYKDKINDFLEDNYELDEDYIKDKINSLEKYKTNFNLEKNQELIKQTINKEKEIFDELRKIVEKNKGKKIIISCKNSNFNNLIFFEQTKNSYILESINEGKKFKALIYGKNNLRNNEFLLNNTQLNLINFLALNTVITTNLESLDFFITKNKFSQKNKEKIIKILKKLKIKKDFLRNILKKEFEQKLKKIEKDDIIKEKIKGKDFGEQLEIKIKGFLFYNKQETEELLKQKYKDIIQKGEYNDNQINSLLNIRNYFGKNIVLSEKKDYKKEFGKIEKNNKLIDKIIKKLKNN